MQNVPRESIGARLSALSNLVRESFWFAPSLLAMAAAGLAFTTVALDRALGDEQQGPSWLYSGDHEGARALLSTVAGSIISVAGVTFSITIAVLSVASQQLGPRAIRSFVRDRGNQLALGTYVATFLYCLLVLRTVRGNSGSTFVPHLSVTTAVALAVASLGVLIWFIHHVAMSIQAEHLVADLTRELHRTLDRLYPSRGDAPAEVHPPSGPPRPIRSNVDGYVQLVRVERLLKLATSYVLVIRIEPRPGDFIVAGDSLASVWPSEAGESIDDAIRASFVFGRTRSAEPASQARGKRTILPAVTGDIRFSVEQIVEIAVRALSPGINDPYTAMTCIDQLGSALCALVEREPPTDCGRDDQGTARLFTHPIPFEEVARGVFEPLVAYSGEAPLVREYLERTLQRIETRAHDQHRRAVLRQFRSRIARVDTTDSGRR